MTTCRVGDPEDVVSGQSEDRRSGQGVNPVMAGRDTVQFQHISTV